MFYSFVVSQWLGLAEVIRRELPRESSFLDNRDTGNALLEVRYPPLLSLDESVTGHPGDGERSATSRWAAEHHRLVVLSSRRRAPDQVAVGRRSRRPSDGARRRWTGRGTGGTCGPLIAAPIGRRPAQVLDGVRYTLYTSDGALEAWAANLYPDECAAELGECACAHPGRRARRVPNREEDSWDEGGPPAPPPAAGDRPSQPRRASSGIAPPPGNRPELP